MNIEIICPLFNAKTYFLNLHKSILEQKDVQISKITYVLTESEDGTEQLLIDNNIDFEKIKKEDFSHSLTRERFALRSQADIVVFVSQDVLITDHYWLKNLVAPIIEGEADAAFSRQVSRHKGIEKYIREKNYPSSSRLVSKDDIKSLGLNTFFFSDVSSAIKSSVFKALNGYDGKNLPTNEDMYLAYKLIMSGHKIKYCADSVVMHSHKYSLKSLYKKYYATGQFFAENDYLNNFGTAKTGSGLAKYVFLRALKEFNLLALFRFPFDMFVRFLGMKRGKASKHKS